MYIYQVLFWWDESLEGITPYSSLLILRKAIGDHLTRNYRHLSHVKVCLLVNEAIENDGLSIGQHVKLQILRQEIDAAKLCEDDHPAMKLPFYDAPERRRYTASEFERHFTSNKFIGPKLGAKGGGYLYFLYVKEYRGRINWTGVEVELAGSDVLYDSLQDIFRLVVPYIDETCDPKLITNDIFHLELSNEAQAAISNADCALHLLWPKLRELFLARQDITGNDVRRAAAEAKLKRTDDEYYQF